jgi:hypothetical protein
VQFVTVDVVSSIVGTKRSYCDSCKLSKTADALYVSFSREVL